VLKTMHTIRVHDPERGWGRVSSASVPLARALYGTGPEVLLFVRWERGGGGWVNPDAIDGLTVENVLGLVNLVRRASVDHVPPMLPCAAIDCRN
jgi:hypothetical protein